MEEHVAILGLEMEKARKKNKPLYVAAIDFKKAIDMVDRASMVEYLRKVGSDNEWLNCLASIYMKKEVTLHMNEEVVGVVERNRRIRQGCKVSSLLFVL